MEDARGWPMLSARSSTWVGPTDGAISTDGYALDEAIMGQDRLALRVVPLRPLFAGFIINTLFYALLLWVLFATPFAARRMLRRRRGQCETCAYPIGVSSVCTECGAAVRPRERMQNEPRA